MALEGPGEERRYGYESVLNMRAEDLMRALLIRDRRVREAKTLRRSTVRRLLPPLLALLQAFWL